MFTGQYNHTIDNKGRLSIPAKFREVLGKEFVLGKGMDSCLVLYAMTDWKTLEEKVNALPLLDASARRISRRLLSGAHAVSVDNHGRIQLPTSLRSFLTRYATAEEGAENLTVDVVFAGVGNHIELWLKEAWDAEEAAQDDEEGLNAAGLALSERGFNI